MDIKREGDQVRISFEEEVERLVAILRSEDREYIYLPSPSDLEGGSYGPYTVGSEMIEQEEGDFCFSWPETVEEISEVEIIFRTCAGSRQNLVVDL